MLQTLASRALFFVAVFVADAAVRVEEKDDDDDVVAATSAFDDIASAAAVIAATSAAAAADDDDDGKERSRRFLRRQTNCLCTFNLALSALKGALRWPWVALVVNSVNSSTSNNSGVVVEVETEASVALL